MNRFPPSVTPATFVGSAIAVGFLLINDLTINEQNAVGTWFSIISDILQTNAAWLDVLIERGIIKTNDAADAESQDTPSKEAQDNQSNCEQQTSTNGETDIEFLKKTLKKMQEEINSISKNDKE